MQEQPSYMNSDRSEKQRSSSKKKGISVSLTPSKNKLINTFDVSRVEVNKINELPIVEYHPASTIYGTNNAHNPERVNFVYQSPIESQVSESLNKKEESHNVEFQIAIDSVIKNEEKPKPNSTQKSQFSPSTLFSNVELKSSTVATENCQKGQEIRPAVFNIVEEISSKVYPIFKNQELTKLTEEENCFLKESNHIEKGNNKSAKKRENLKQEEENMLEMISECTFETSDQLIKLKKEEIHKEKVLKKNTLSNHNNNSEYFLQEEQRKKIERLKKAEEKLLKIIKVCDQGL